MIAIVVPTVRPESMAEWLCRWPGVQDVARLYVVEDGPTRTIDLPAGVNHYSWAEIDDDLCGDSWIIPRQTDCVRSYGYLAAHRDGADITITLDDDCYPLDGMSAEAFIAAHVARLTDAGRSDAWTSTMRTTKPRGVPYLETHRKPRCVLNHGMWNSVPDFDAVTQLASTRLAVGRKHNSFTLSRGQYFPMCGMNLAWSRDMTPAMWFLLMGRNYEYDRFGDIWCGVFAKRIIDHLGLAVKTGEPAIHHDRASNVWANLRKEAPGMEVNETLWRAVDSVVLTGTTVAACYLELMAALPVSGEYWDRLRDGAAVWVRHVNGGA